MGFGIWDLRARSKPGHPGRDSWPYSVQGAGRTLSVRQREDVQRVAVFGVVDVGRNRSRHLSRAAASQTRRDRDVLLARDAERDREALNGGSEAGLPQNLPGLHVERAEVAIEIADKGHAAGGGQNSREKRRPLLIIPDLAERVDVVGGELADVTVA